jgi:hypothetical protein
MRRSWTILLLAACACGRADAPRPARDSGVSERVDTLHLAFAEGDVLPEWAACWFPHLSLYVPATCPAETAATGSYTAQELAGCWMIEQRDGRPLRDRFFSAPAHLTRRTSLKMRQMGSDGRGIHELRTLAPYPDSMAIDTAFSVSVWRFAAPDSLTLERSFGYSGTSYHFRVRGDSMVGIALFHDDVIEPRLEPDPVQPVRGRRVPCPAE